MPANRIQKLWQTFKQDALPKGEPIEVLIERRRMFFAGAQALVKIMDSQESDTDNGIVRIAMDIQEELAAETQICGTEAEEARA